MPTLINPTVRAGENRVLTLYARDYQNAPLNLSGASVEWRVGRGSGALDSTWPVFTKSGTVVNASAGEFTVTVQEADTRAMEGDYLHQAWITSGAASYVVCEGRFRVKPWLES